ncbi:hypothetical protein Btru_042466 [Bulinus truncatus]|nr:hypothetical protein Btru_042466 [Bulinus truncatus]
MDVKEGDTPSELHKESEEKEESKRKDLATCEKNKGNEFYKLGDYDKAIEAYTQGMTYDPTDALLPANRAMAYLQLKRYVKCEEDCSLSLSIDPSHIKSYLRRATARFNLGRLTEATEDYQRVLDIDPRNEQAMSELQKIEKYKQSPLQHMTENYNRRRGDRTDDLQLLQEGLELDDYLSRCTKYPGHVNFFPVDQFRLDKLPDNYRDDEIFQLIMAAADLTVRIGVHVVSQKDSPLVTLDKGTWTRTDVFVDSFIMTRVTCDAQLGERISEMCRRFRRIWGAVGDRYARKSDDRFVFIVSHPHGGPKKISFGTILDTMDAGGQEELDLSIWGYTTNTCPGSSGASVFGLHLGGVFVHNGTYKDMFNFATGYHLKK